MDREDVFKHAQGTLVSWLLGSMVAFAGVGAGQTAAALWVDSVVVLLPSDTASVPDRRRRRCGVSSVRWRI